MNDDSPQPTAADDQDVRRPRNPVTWLLLLAVRGYQLIVSPWFGQTCKYYPSCSAYAVTALRRHGAVRGTGLAVWRVLRCNPWSLGGVDHVPAVREPGPAMQETGGGARTLGQTAGAPDGTGSSTRGALDAPQDL